MTTATREPLPTPVLPAPSFLPTELLRARVLDDFDGVAARDLYWEAIRRGPQRTQAAHAYFTSGLIHGDWWRPAVVMLFAGAATLPFAWRWPHRYRLLYETSNAPPPARWRHAQLALRRTGNASEFLVAAASAAKEVDPASAVDVAKRAQRQAGDARHPANAAWATFSLSLSLRWLGRLEEASDEADRLADGFDSLAKPVWVAWGHFEYGALATLQNDASRGSTEMLLAREIFAAAGEHRFVFDATCGALTASRLAGDWDRVTELRSEARAMIDSAQRTSQFAHDVLVLEEAEIDRAAGRLGDAAARYERLTGSPTVAQELLALLGLGEVQRQMSQPATAALQALKRSKETGFSYGTVHAAVTLALAGNIENDEAEALIATAAYKPPERSGIDGIERFLLGSVPDQHGLYFP